MVLYLTWKSCDIFRSSNQVGFGAIKFIGLLWDVELVRDNFKERWKKEISVGRRYVTDIWKCASTIFWHINNSRIPSFQLFELFTSPIHKKKGHLPNCLIMGSFHSFAGMHKVVNFCCFHSKTAGFFG